MKRNSNRTIKKRMLALLLCATMTLNGGLSVLAEEIQSTAAETMATEETEAIEPVMISEEPTSQAETETKQETKQETETETKQETKQETETETKQETKQETETETKQETKQETETETKQETKQETETETKQETKQETETETETESETETETETEAETEAREFKYEDAAVEIKVVAKEGTSIPKGASLKVTPINKEEITDDMSDSKKKEVREINDQYDSTEELLKEKVASDSGNVLKGFLAYDIKFVDTNGKEVEPDGNVEVSIQYKSASIPDEVDAGSDADITVMHLTENKAGKVLKIIDMKKEKLLKDINITNSKKIKKAKFITDSFSVYAIVWTAAEAVVRTLKADVTELRITAKIANADSTGTFVLEDVEIPVTKNADELATAEDQYQKFADFSKSGSKNQITIDDAIYRFEGAYVTTNEMYGQDPSTEKKIDALRIFGNEIQFRTEGTTTWTDIKETSTYNLFLVYKEQSKTITLTAVLADASKKDLGEIKVTLTREQLEDGTLAVESPVKLISSLVAYNQEPSSDKPIPESYKVNGKVYKFRNAVLIGNDLSSFTKVTYRDAYNKNAKKTTISATTNTVFVQGLKLNDTKIQYQPNDTQTFDIGARKIVLVYAEDLHTVPTIDSTSLGVTMRMINFRVRQTDFGGPYGDQVGRTPGLLTKTVKANGYPSTSDGKVDFETWFGENPTGDANLISSQPVNHLFLKSYFDSTGTFHFSGFENYAYLNQDTGNFTVYKEIGATDATNKNTYKRGNFFPFNNIAPGVYSPYVNTFDSSGAVLPNTNPRKNENLYTGITDEDYNFGMYLETKFAQPMDGYYRGQPMRFEFNGDDDFWVYIDGVLVLDIGGIHNAQDGYIDFSTGQVYVKPLSKSGAENWEDTTIKAKFIEALGEDGIDEYMFEGNTFADATIHTMQIFYMERGEGASTLHLNFNLPTIPASALQVEKQLGDTEQELYTDENFAFRVYAQPISGYETQLDEYGNEVQVELYDENAAKSEYVVLGEGSGAYIGNSDAKIKFEEDGTFYLKAGETAIFPEIQVNRKYYVEEINLDKIKWDVPKTKYTEDGADTMLPEVSISEDATELETDIRRLSERKKVTFYNYMKEPGNIQIEKKIVNGNQNPDYGFDFKVTVKHAVSGKMVPYAGEYYYLKDKDTGQYIDSNGNLQEPGTTPTAYDRIGNGVIKNVKVGQVVELRGFYEGTEFAVEEVNLKNIYETPVITYDGEEVDSVYKVKGDSTISIVVTNKEKYQYDWTFYKQSKSDSSKLLEGAEFELSSQSKTYYGKSIKDDSTTNVNEAGMIVWYEDGSKVEQIAPGTYQFKETKAPTGYTLSEEVWTVVFADEASPIVYRDENQNGIPEESELIDNHRKDKIDETGMHHVITSFYFENEMLYELPTTGGPGIYWYMISGVALMMGATLTVYKKRREEVLR